MMIKFLHSLFKQMMFVGLISIVVTMGLKANAMATTLGGNWDDWTGSGAKVWNFNGLNQTTGAGNLHIEISGDFDEFAEDAMLEIDGQNITNAIGVGLSTPTTYDFTILQADMENFLSDCSLVVIARLGPNVDAVENDYFNWTLEYSEASGPPVPEPNSLLLLGLGLLGFAGAARKKLT